MSSHVIATTVTRESWSFLLKNFSYLLSIILIPFILSIALNGFATFSFLKHHALPQALTDGAGAFIEALWGIRWFKFILEKPSAGDLPKFSFGKKELLYFAYSFLLLVPFMLDDFLFIKNIRVHHAFLYALATIGTLVVFLRFELLFPALAMGKTATLKESWKQSRPLWGRIFKSYFQSFMVMLPIATIGLLWLGLLFIALWAAGILHFEHWTMQEGWKVLLDRNPLIRWIYIVFKEALWMFAQAFTMVIAATYYRLSKV